MSTTAIGRLAEAQAAQYLQQHGYNILATNWRGRHCEIDIVAKRGRAIYICEVKYRTTHRQGGGIEYITPAKIRQLMRAADTWAAVSGWQGEYQLCAIEVSGPELVVTAFVDAI